MIELYNINFLSSDTIILEISIKFKNIINVKLLLN